MADNVREFNDDNFESDVLQSEEPVRVDFWATYCQPCKLLVPTIAAIASEYEGRLRVGKLNTQEAGRSAAQFRIQGVPTLMLFKNGEVADTILGAVPKEQITAMIDKHLGQAG